MNHFSFSTAARSNFSTSTQGTISQFLNRLLLNADRESAKALQPVKASTRSCGRSGLVWSKSTTSVLENRVQLAHRPIQKRERQSGDNRQTRRNRLSAQLVEQAQKVGGSSSIRKLAIANDAEWSGKGIKVVRTDIATE